MRDNGQATLELILSSALVILTLTGSGWLLKAQWERSKCAYLVFEATHARLSGRPFALSRVQVRISEDESAVRGEGVCGGSVEKVVLPRLATIGRSFW